MQLVQILDKAAEKKKIKFKKNLSTFENETST